MPNIVLTYSKGTYDLPIIANKVEVQKAINNIQQNIFMPHYRECLICHKLINQNNNTHWICTPNINISLADVETTTYTFSVNTITKNNIKITSHDILQPVNILVSQLSSEISTTKTTNKERTQQYQTILLFNILLFDIFIYIIKQLQRKII